MNEKLFIGNVASSDIACGLFNYSAHPWGTYSSNSSVNECGTQYITLHFNCSPKLSNAYAYV